MNFEVIQALRAACNGFIDPVLERDYIELPAADVASQQVTEAISAGQLDELDELCADAAYERENQGYINGFRLGVRLMAECTGASPQSTGTPGNVTPIPSPRPAGAETSKQDTEGGKVDFSAMRGDAEAVRAMFGPVKAICEAIQDYISHNVKVTPFDEAVSLCMGYHADSLQELLAGAMHLLYEMEEQQGKLIHALYAQQSAAKGVA